ncbi:LysR family transcriptional regulator [Alicyclobacillus fastidiosus]|uniref:LysR family transcriptional regulator n=1 Tax=Alicyclobacillus fastidiosus TaxID=392011 RepID=A0ABY6ZCG4_9BACL|nr:LysR family transcriptional regulator [Alicyclobacillus fastidiosus]WAH40542.1 LysR family transcriptional regulator [Alicyclobacillus fastidiosus]GMA61974.1 LysR family transcriptional regulator [Alicyclobacillus fastidiosus]
MTFDQLVAFVSVARTRNFTATAKVLHLAQPAVTSRIKNLESEIGVTLLQRFDGALELTAAGRRLLEYAQQIIDLVEQAKVEVGQQVQEILIGATSTLAVHFVPKILKLVYQWNQNAKFIVRQAESLSLLSLLLDGNLDMAFMTHRIEHPDIILTQLKESLRVVLVASSNHPILLESNITYEVVKKYKLMRTQRKHGFWKLVDNKLKEYDIEIETDVIVDNMEIAKEILLQSAFLTFMPYLSIEKELERGVLTSIHVENLPVLEFPIYMINHQQSHQSRNVQLIRRVLGLGD